MSELMTAADVKRYLVHCGAAVAIVEARLEPLIYEVGVELRTLREILCVGLGDQPASERGERDFFSAVARANANGAAVPCAPTDPAMFSELDKSLSVESLAKWTGGLKPTNSLSSRSRSRRNELERKVRSPSVKSPRNVRHAMRP